MVVVPGDAPGVSHPPDWDNLGQRRTASGSIAFHDVEVPAGAVLATFPADEDDTSPRRLRLSLLALASQAVLTQVFVGIAEGALDDAARYTRARSRPWPAGGVDRATDDPHVQAGYGELVAGARAARLCAEDATGALVAPDARGLALTDAERGRAALAVTTARVVATDRKSTRLNSSHLSVSRMPSSA